MLLIFHYLLYFFGAYSNIESTIQYFLQSFFLLLHNTDQTLVFCSNFQNNYHFIKLKTHSIIFNSSNWFFSFITAFFTTSFSHLQKLKKLHWIFFLKFLSNFTSHTSFFFFLNFIYLFPSTPLSLSLSHRIIHWLSQVALVNYSIFFSIDIPAQLHSLPLFHAFSPIFLKKKSHFKSLK